MTIRLTNKKKIRSHSENKNRIPININKNSLFLAVDCYAGGQFTALG